MKKTITMSTVISALLLSSTVVAENFTQGNVNQAQRVIEQALIAYGGQDKISGIEQIFIDYDVENINAGQSLKAEPPWDLTRGDRKDAFDFINQKVITEFAGEGGGNRFAGRTVINGEMSYNSDPYRKTVSTIEQPNFEQTAGPGIRVNSTLVLRQLNQYANSASYMGEQQLNKKAHDVVRFTLPGGPAITVYVDQKNHLISKTERVTGPFLVEYYFKDYKKVDGILFPHSSSYTVNGDPSQTFNVEQYKVNQSLDSWLTPPKNYTKVASTPPSDSVTTELANGVYWVKQNNQNSLFVEFNDHLVMVGGLAGAKQRIDEIAKKVPNKPVKYTVMTHHHNDHIGGAQDIVNNSTQIVAVTEHKKVIAESLDDAKLAKFDLVTSSRTFDDGNMLLELYDVGPTPHAEHYLMAYLPKQGILFDADHFLIPAAGPMPAATPNVNHLVKSIKERGLTIKTIASAHSNRLASFDDLMASFNKHYAPKSKS